LLGACVWTAVKNALSYTRANGDPVELGLPATPEQILRVLTRHAKAARSQVVAK
jgi:hypothetical protein